MRECLRISGSEKERECVRVSGSMNEKKRELVVRVSGSIKSVRVSGSMI